MNLLMSIASWSAYINWRFGPPSSTTFAVLVFVVPFMIGVVTGCILWSQPKI